MAGASGYVMRVGLWGKGGNWAWRECAKTNHRGRRGGGSSWAKRMSWARRKSWDGVWHAMRSREWESRGDGLSVRGSGVGLGPGGEGGRLAGVRTGGVWGWAMI